MKGKLATPAEGRTNWKRFALAIVPIAAVAAAVLAMTAEGSLAASFTISGQQAKISADSLDGTGFAQYGWLDQTARGEAVPVAVAAIKHAELKNMCQSVVLSLPIVGDLTLKINAGADKAVTAEDLSIDMDQLNGDATFTNIEIGRDASTLDQGAAGGQGLQDTFAQQADTVHIDKLRQTMYATHAGIFRLNGLRLKVVNGNSSCW
jgi:nucleoid-associated protein YgaU